jgi:branched-chain amino acid transport system permease protein
LSRDGTDTRRTAIGQIVTDLAAAGSRGALLGPVLVVSLATAVVAVAGDALLTRVAIVALINLTIVVGMYIFIGNSGVLSFGHIAFMAIGAYVAGLLTIPVAQKAVLLPSLPHAIMQLSGSSLEGTLAAAAVAGVVALLLAIPLMRLSGLSAGIATFALLQVVFVVASNWNEVTGGAAGLLGIPLDLTLASAWVWSTVVIALAYAFKTSSIGLKLRASRDDESAAAAAGISIVRERIAAFVVSAAVVAIGGSLYAHFFGTISPTSFYVPTTFITLAMLVVGGMTSLSGAVIGVLAVSVLSEALVRVEAATSLYALREVVLALVMLGILIARPSGISGGLEFNWRLAADAVERGLNRSRLSRRHRPEEADASSTRRDQG